MAQLPQAYNVEGNNESLEDFSAIPAGDYTAMIKSSIYKQTKAKTGHYLELMWVVVGGPLRGKVLFDRLNLDNPNPVAVQIASKTLNSICKAAGVIGAQDSEELHGKPCTLTVSVKAATAAQPESNEIKAYSGSTYSDDGSVAPANPTDFAVTSQVQTNAMPTEQPPPVTQVPLVNQAAAPVTHPAAQPAGRAKLPWE